MRTATDAQFIMAGGWLLFLCVTLSLALAGEIRSLFFRSSVIVLLFVVSEVSTIFRTLNWSRIVLFVRIVDKSGLIIPGVFSLSVLS